MRIISRSEWGAAPPKTVGGPWAPGQPSSKTLHYSSGNVPTSEPEAFYAGVVRGIQRYQLNHPTEQYRDIAYNFLVSPTGLIFEGRGWGSPSGAQKDGNRESVAVCYLGGPDTPFTTPGQWAASWLCNQLTGPVYPHSHWVATSCPGPSISSWLVAGGVATPAPGTTPPIDWKAVQAAVFALRRKRFPMWLIRDSRTGGIYVFNGQTARLLDPVTVGIQQALMAQLGIPNNVSDQQNYLIDRLRGQGVLVDKFG